jgi:hypothetical protein
MLLSSVALLLAAGIAAGCSSGEGAGTSPAPRWQQLEPGLELGVLPAPRESAVGDSIVRVLRIDPERFELRLLNASALEDRRPRTARDWSRSHDLVAAINASMYQADHITSVSLMLRPGHVNNPRVSKDNTILAFNRRSPEVPPVKMIDRECDDLEWWREQYGTLVQSIRMWSCRGRNVWEPQSRRFSTAAIATDDRGRVLFIHVRSPYTTHDLIDILSELPLGLSRAMYVEGGPEAQMYVRAGTFEAEWVGGFETATAEDSNNRLAWPVPNVIGISRR